MDEKVEKVKKLKEILKKLPEDVRKDVLKKEISLKDGISIATIPNLELRKEATKIIKRQINTKKFVIQEAIDITNGVSKPTVRKVKSERERLLEQFARIHKQVAMKMHLKLVNSFDKETREILIGHMRSVMCLLIEEFKNDESIEAKVKFLPDKVIDITDKVVNIKE